MSYTFTQGSGTTASSDTGISGQHVPRVKVTFGDTGTITDVTAANAMPVTDTSLLRSGGILVDLGSNNDVVATNAGTFATQATLQAGTAAVGKLTANSGVDIGDVDVTSIVLPRSQIGPAEPGTGIDSYTHVAINLTTGADQVLVSSSANKQIWVYGYGLTCGDANGQTVSLQDEDNVALTGIMEFSQYGGISVPPSGNFSMPLFKLGTNKDLEIDITSGDVDGWLVYAILSV